MIVVGIERLTQTEVIHVFKENYSGLLPKLTCTKLKYHLLGKSEQCEHNNEYIFTSSQCWYEDTSLERCKLQLVGRDDNPFCDKWLVNQPVHSVIIPQGASHSLIF